MAKKIGILIIFVLIAVFVWLGYGYIRHRQLYAVSDAGFIKSDRLATLSFKVPGKVTQMRVQENQPVKAGEVLATIDPTDLLNAKAQAEYRWEALRAQLKAQELKRKRVARVFALQTQIAQTQIDAAGSQIDATRALRNAAKAKLAKLEKDTRRYATMLEGHLISEGEFETIKAQRDATRDQVHAQTMQIRAEQAQKVKAAKGHELAAASGEEIRELDQAIAATRAQIRVLDAVIEEGDNRIAYTKLTAPFDGVIARRFVVAPRVVAAGSPIYALIDPRALYAEVLLSEKKLHGIHPGSPVEITVDALEDKAITAEVESIAPASASTFSLVPRDIASGEFTKLDQRFVVRIRLKELSGLRAGMSVAVAIRRDAS